MVIILVDIFQVNAQQKQPNIIWITCADISPYVGAYGDPVVSTPHIDQLSKEGDLPTKIGHSKIKNRKSDKKMRFSGKVPGTGIEPAHPCERQILSLLRLPIPPPGLRLGCNITHCGNFVQKPL
jgi:hypothetical protein